MNPVRVLFICTGNSARSQMCEALLRKHGGEMYQAFSAGLEPKGIHPLTKVVMEEIGIDMNSHSSKPLSKYMGKEHFDYVITVCSHADESCPSVFPGAESRLHWDFEDPAAFNGTHEEKLRKFREVRELIDERIKAWLVRNN